MSFLPFRRSELAVAALLLAVPVAALAVPERSSNSSTELLARLQGNTGGALLSQVVPNEAYTAVLARGNAVLLSDNISAAPVDRAQNFLSIYGALAGVSDPLAQLKPLRTSSGGNGQRHVHLEQMQSGLPVFGARLMVHMNGSGVTGMSGVFLKGFEQLSTTPALDIATLRGHALAATTKLHPGSAKKLRVEAGRLMFYNTGLLQGLAGSNYLAYEVMVRGSGAEPVREQIILDANTGAVLNRINRIETALHRITYYGQYQGPKLYEEGNPLGTSPSPADPAFATTDGETIPASTRTQNEPAANLHIFAGGTWKLYKNLFGRDGYNDGSKPSADQRQESVYLINDQCPNAYWDGTSANYCPGFDLDDVVSHEWSHGYTEYLDNLVYQYQSGALNEAYSDIFGETYDLVNGIEGRGGQTLTEGNYYKTGGSRWVVGEDLTDQAAGLLLRDMWDPEDFPSPSPGRVGSTDYECGTGDGGGVHTNSGVPNHAYAMLVDGRPNAKDTSTYNNTAVPKIGMIKAANIFFAAKRDYQGPTTNFRQHADALDAACQDLKTAGTNLKNLNGQPSGQVVTEADCNAVKAAAVAVSYRANVTALCNYQPILKPEASTPALCPAGQAASKFFSQGFNTAATLPAGWTTGMAFGATGNTAIPNWTTTTDLPPPHTGRAAFFANNKGGNCSSVDHSASYWLETPAITVPNGSSKLTFTHFMQSEGLFDGGNIKYALNGGTTWTIVPPAAMTPATGGYNPHSGTFDAATPIGNNTSPNAGQAAWTGSDQGEATGSWGTTIINFAQFAAATRPVAGNTIKFRYDFAQDGCNGNLGWFVDQVDGYFCVANAAPTARVVVTPTSGIAPLMVSFDAATSSDPDAGDSVTSYTINFGDGSAAVTQPTPGFSHSYSAAGSYTPSITVQDSRGTASSTVMASTVTVSAAASGPTEFSFVERTKVQTRTFITSESVTMSGYTGSLPISVSSGGQYSINGSAFVSAAGNIASGAKLTVRHLSSSAENTSTTTTVTVGTYATPFKSTTITLDRVPDAFTFGTLSNQTANTQVVSAPVTLTGFDTASVVAGPDADYSINGGSFTRSSGTLLSGQSLTVRHTTNAASLGYSKTYLRVGGVTGYFTTRTKK